MGIAAVTAQLAELLQAVAQEHLASPPSALPGIGVFPELRALQSDFVHLRVGFLITFRVMFHTNCK